MRVTLNFPSKMEEDIRRAFNGDGTIEKQMQFVILQHVGNSELRAYKAELDQSNQSKVNEKAQAITKKYGL